MQEERQYYLVGELYSIYFHKNNKKQGKYICFYEDGDISIMQNYKNGIRHGVIESFSRQTKRRNYTYIINNNIKHGAFIMFNYYEKYSKIIL